MTVVTLQNGLDGYAECYDTWLNKDANSNNFGIYGSLWIRNWSGTYRTLIKFDLSSLGIVTVISGHLWLYFYDMAAGGTYAAHKMLKPFDEGTENNSPIDNPGEHGTTRINQYDFFPGEGADVAWAATGMLSGTDFEASNMGSATFPAVDNWGDMTLTTAKLQEMINSPSTNYGMALVSGASTNTRCRSSDFVTDITKRPKLVLEYEDIAGKFARRSLMMGLG